MKTIAEVLGVARSHLHERVHRPTAPRSHYRKAADEELLPLIRRVVDERPTYGYRRVTALVNRLLAAEGKATANHKRVFRIMKRQGLLLQRHSGRRTGRLHDGKVVVMRSNLRWCSDVFEITCWDGDIVRIVFVIDAHDREVLAWHAAAGTGISGSMVRDLMLEAVELSRQRQCLHRQRDARLRRCSRPGAVLHPGAEPGVERHCRSLRQNVQARLRSRSSIAGCCYSAPADRQVVR
jgi:putative transposase